MDSPIRPIKGIQLDVHPTAQPKDTTREVRNMVLYSKEGNLMSLSNENGTTDLPNGIPNGFFIIGQTVLDNEAIVILCDESNNNQVGVMSIDGVYTPIAPLDGFTVPTNNKEFGFTKNHAVDCQARKTIDGHRILYFTDNNVPFGYVDLDNPPLVGNVKDTVSLTPSQKIPVIDLIEVKENVQGNLKASTYFFVTRYRTKTGGYTSFGIPSNGIPIYESLLSGNVSEVKGIDYTTTVSSITTETRISKNIVLRFSNIDTLYTELQVVACWFDDKGVLQSYKDADLTINDDVLDYTFSGIDSSETLSFTLEELRKTTINYRYAQAIEQKDNVLFLSGLRSETEDSETLQNIANNITVKYDIEEVPYCNREVTGYTPIQKFSLLEIVKVGRNRLMYTFNEDIELTPALLNFTLYQNYKVATASLTVTSFVTAGTVVLQDGNLSGNVTLTATTGTPSTVLEFQTITSNAVTASNLVTVINNNCPNYFAEIDSVTSNKINLYWSGDIAAGTGYGNTKTITVPGWITLSGAMSGGGTFSTPYPVIPSSYQVTGKSITCIFDVAATVNYIPAETAVKASIITVNNLAVTESYSPGFDSSLNPVVFDIKSNTTLTAVNVNLQNPIEDYINPVTCFYKKGYRRDEVYSLGFYLVYNTGAKSSVYHIPGNDHTVVTQGKNAANTITNELGTYVSSLDYPSSQGYLTGKIRHHVMPSLKQEPSYRFDNITNITYIRILGLAFTLNIELPDEIKSSVSEIVFVRELRDTENKRSVLSQGLLSNFVISAQIFNGSSFHDTKDRLNSVQGKVDTVNGYHIQSIPFCNRLRSSRVVKTSIGSGGYFSRSRGVAYPGYWLDSNTNAAINWPSTQSGWGSFTESLVNTYASFNKLNTDIVDDQVMFYSPETILNTSFSVTNANGLSFKKASKLKGYIKKINNVKDKWRAVSDFWSSAAESFQAYYGYTDMYINFYTSDSMTTEDSYTIEKSNAILSGSSTKSKSLFNTGSPVNGGNNIFGVNSMWSPGGLHCKLSSGISLAETASEIRYFDIQIDKMLGFSDSNQNDIEGSYIDYYNSPSSDSITGEVIKEYLYNLEADLTSQYGGIGNGEYIVIGRKNYVDSPAVEYKTLFGGDTYITKFAFNNGNLIYKNTLKQYLHGDFNGPRGQNAGSNLHDRTTYQYLERANTAVHPSLLPTYTNLQPNGYAHGMMCKDVTYYFVESDINTYYRHSPQDETLKLYVPSQTDLPTLFNQWPLYRGNVENYNGLYSYENKLTTYYSRGSSQIIVNSFPNRTIWSEKAQTDSTVDSYRSFLVDNYYDLPSHTGPIIDSFVDNGTLYLHTTKCLWKTFAEPAAMLQASNIQEVVLGTGSLFSRPSIPVVTSKGGFGGTLSRFAGVKTPIGYVFPDTLQSSIFLLKDSKDGVGLEDLGEKGLITFFNDNIQNNLGDNPYYGDGFTAAFDFKLMRYVLTKKGTDPFTLSFSMLNQAWISYHDYYPNLLLEINNRFFMYDKNTNRYVEMNTGNKGSYFGTVHDSSITYSIGDGTPLSYTNYVIESYSNDNTGKRVMKDCFYKVQAYNYFRNTGEVLLEHLEYDDDTPTFGYQAIKYRNEEYRTSVPRDLVKTINNDIFDSSNLYVVSDEEYHYSKRMKGDYLITKFTYSNQLNYNFALNQINTIFDNNIR